MVTHKMLTKCVGTGTDVGHKPRSLEVRRAKHREPSVGLGTSATSKLVAAATLEREGLSRCHHHK